MVAEFHQKFDLPNLVGEPSIVEERKALRFELIREEVEELRVALEAHDKIETADALADIVYVAVGAALEFGIDLEAVQLEMIPVGDFREMAKTVEVLRLAVGISNVTGVSVCLAKICQIAYVMAKRYSIPLDAVLEEVHRSNMTKVWADGTVHKREDGKVLKPPTYSPADIGSVLAYDAVEEPLCNCDNNNYPCEVHDT